MAISTYLQIITLNVIGMSIPIKRYRVTGWIKDKSRIYAAYNRFNSELQIHTD